MKNSLEKISFIQILGDKICIAIVSKMYVNTAGNLTLLGIFLKKKKKNNHNCFHVIYLPVFTSSSELGRLCVLYMVIDFL